jgi:hypothetical protein
MHCTSNCSHVLHMRVDHVKHELEFQAEQVRWMFGGPQASSYEDDNIVVIKVSPSASHQSSLAFLSIIIIMVRWIVHLSL